MRSSLADWSAFYPIAAGCALRARARIRDPLRPGRESCSIPLRIRPRFLEVSRRWHESPQSCSRASPSAIRAPRWKSSAPSGRRSRRPDTRSISRSSIRDSTRTRAPRCVRSKETASPSICPTATTDSRPSSPARSPSVAAMPSSSCFSPRRPRWNPARWPDFSSSRTLTGMSTPSCRRSASPASPGSASPRRRSPTSARVKPSARPCTGSTPRARSRARTHSSTRLRCWYGEAHSKRPPRAPGPRTRPCWTRSLVQEDAVSTSRTSRSALRRTSPRKERRPTVSRCVSASGGEATTVPAPCARRAAAFSARGSGGSLAAIARTSRTSGERSKGPRKFEPARARRLCPSRLAAVTEAPHPGSCRSRQAPGSRSRSAPWSPRRRSSSSPSLGLCPQAATTYGSSIPDRSRSWSVAF